MENFEIFCSECGCSNVKFETYVTGTQFDSLLIITEIKCKQCNEKEVVKEIEV